MSLCRAILLVGILSAAWLFQTGDADPTRFGSRPILPDRFQILKESLEWVTFRRGGALISDNGLRYPFFYNFLNTYTDSGKFRSVVVAFIDGVAPKLTLKAGDQCNSYISNYKNPYTNQFGWHETKNFIFSTYETRETDSTQYCDFRLGLVCNPQSRKCECRTGAEMTAIAPNSNIQRCLLKEDQACALPDFDYLHPENFYNHWVVYMIFNPERWEGCQPGKECRLIQGSSVARCYDPAKHSNNWDPESTPGYPGLPIGSPCSINFGQGIDTLRCDPYFNWKDDNEDRELQCYNFGPRDGGGISSPGDVPREGFCAHAGGSYQIRRFWYGDWKDMKKVYRIWPGNFIMGFVNPRTTPFTQEELEKYYEKYMEQVYPHIFGGDKDDPTGEYDFDLLLSSKVGASCSHAKTEKMKGIWEFYAKLEGSPMTVTKQQLHDELDKMIELVDKSKGEGKFCKVFWSYDLAGKELDPLECVKDPGAAGNTNDGTCQKYDPQDQGKGKAFAKKLYDFQEYLVKVGMEEEEKDEEDLDPHLEIWEKNKDPETCTEYAIGHPCPDDKWICFRDYRDRDYLYGYNDPTCQLRHTPELRCMEMDPDPNLSNSLVCEDMTMKRLLKEVVDQLVGTLGKGDTCNTTLEQELRELIEDHGEGDHGDKYRFISYLKRSRYCDRTRLLTCDMATKKCVCYPGTKPRSAMIGGQLYESDYCYAESGSCSDLNPFLNPTAEPLNTGEKEGIKSHYGTPNQNCDGGNFCLFVDAKRKQCTGQNTGNTGYGPITTTDGGTGGGDGDGAGGGGDGSLGGGGIGGSSDGKSGGATSTSKVQNSVVAQILAFLSVFVNIIMKNF